MRELFIYWRTPAATARQAIDAASRWQARLRTHQPGLAATLYRRDEAAAGDTATLMEVYAGPLDAAVERHIVEEGARVLAPWLAGPRHVEAFERCGRE